MVVDHMHSFHFDCFRPHWVRNLLAPATGRYDVLGSFFVWETGFWVDLFVGHPLVWVADVASVFDKRLF